MAEEAVEKEQQVDAGVPVVYPYDISVSKKNIWIIEG